ncbi:hypothetical protein K1W54_07530 [Micromonospora sp. CPCC 205371]|nr:hypothetical protein [Micromonospora sp. CPCC 205371]
MSRVTGPRCYGDRDGHVSCSSGRRANDPRGSIGTALLNTIATSATAAYLASHAAQGRSPAFAKKAMLEGFVTAGTWAAGILLAGALIVAVLMNTPRPKHPAVTQDAESAGAAEDTEPALLFTATDLDGNTVLITDR